MKLEDEEAKDEGSRNDRHLEPTRDLATRLDRLDFITLKLGIAAFGKHGRKRSPRFTFLPGRAGMEGVF